MTAPEPTTPRPLVVADGPLDSMVEGDRNARSAAFGVSFDRLPRRALR
ncbi:MAG TPA: hypothetical protein VKP69_11420 [Isosphaeraceae bacterium]|nr:hypothetical protein [Isosphaeraceae bacterium]